MRQCVLVNGLKEEDFMTLRWNADVHTVHRKTGEYRILNNKGTCLGELVKNNGSYQIIVYERDMENIYSEIGKEIKTLRDTSKEIINKELKSPAICNEKKIINSSPYIRHYQNSFRNASYQDSLKDAA